MNEQPYKVEIEADGCPSCEHGRQFVVVGPDGCADGTSYLEEDDADDIAELQNDAYAEGYKHAMAELAKAR